MDCDVVGGAVDGGFALYRIELALWFHPHAARIYPAVGGNPFSLHPCGGNREEAFLSESEVLSLLNGGSALSSSLRPRHNGRPLWLFRSLQVSKHFRLEAGPPSYGVGDPSESGEADFFDALIR